MKTIKEKCTYCNKDATGYVGLTTIKQYPICDEHLYQEIEIRKSKSYIESKKIIS